MTPEPATLQPSYKGSEIPPVVSDPPYTQARTGRPELEVAFWGAQTSRYRLANRQARARHGMQLWNLTNLPTEVRSRRKCYQIEYMLALLSRHLASRLRTFGRRAPEKQIGGRPWEPSQKVCFCSKPRSMYHRRRHHSRFHL